MLILVVNNLYHNQNFKADQDRLLKEHQIKTLNADIHEQEVIITRLTKEKKLANETIQKTSEDLQASEDRNTHLNKVCILVT